MVGYACNPSTQEAEVESHGFEASLTSKKKKSQVPVAHAVILATQKAEIRRITVRSQPGQIVI
jgi:hypothetical protein